MNAPVHPGFWIRVVYAICLLGASYNHAHQLMEHGLGWDYGGVPKLSAVFWTSLAFADPAASLLLFWRPRAGLLVTASIILSDVMHNTWFGFRSAPFIQALQQSTRNLPYLEQIAFMLFVLATIKIPWTERRRADELRHR